MAASKKQEIAVAEDKSIVVFDPAMMAQDSGIGRESLGVQDLALPYLTILQALSPQVMKSNPKRVDGAEEGDLFNTVSMEIFDSRDGVLVVPCAYQRANVEWMPRDSGGGFVASHAGDEILGQTHRDERGFDVLANGNLIIPTGYMYCLITDKEQQRHQPVVVSFARTQMKKVRRWNSQMAAIEWSGPNGLFNPPMFANVYRLCTLPESKKNYNWFGWDILAYEKVSNMQLYLAAKKFAVDVVKGMVKVSTPELDTDIDPGEGVGGAEPF
jgi:hypothetical protein